MPDEPKGALTVPAHARAIVSILVQKLGGKITLTPADYAAIEGTTLSENVKVVDVKVQSFDITFELSEPQPRNLQ